ncbi:MAG: hypothetical protein AAFN74_23345 [Myxococcota bacterium]
MKSRLIGSILGSMMFTAGCSLLLDFDDIEGLPCDCQTGFVCLSTSNTCVPSESVDDFKSCDINATPNPNDQCKPGRDCVVLNSGGARCLPRCTPVNPFVADVGRLVAQECGVGQYCWELSAGVGYCDDGECNDLPETCPPPERCVRINGAGVCFQVCDIFDNNMPCGATGEHCQPVAESRVMACLPSGTQASGQPCGVAEGACAPTDAQNRGLICTRLLNSTNELRRCAPRCNFNLGNVDCQLPGEGCFAAITDIDSVGTDLGICQGGG